MLMSGLWALGARQSPTPFAALRLTPTYAWLSSDFTAGEGIDWCGRPRMVRPGADVMIRGLVSSFWADIARGVGADPRHATAVLWVPSWAVG
jgi:hypothetical protein